MLDGGEEVVVALVIAGGDCAEVFELAEEPLDLIALAIQHRIEGREAFSRRHEPDVGDDPACGEAVAQTVAVIAPVGEQRLAAAPMPSVMSAPDRPSCAWPSVSFRRIGRPRASTSAWIFVVSPPRQRPMQ